MRDDEKCLVCDTPVLLLRLTGECGTDDESTPCPFAPPLPSPPVGEGGPT